MLIVYFSGIEEKTKWRKKGKVKEREKGTEEREGGEGETDKQRKVGETSKKRELKDTFLNVYTGTLFLAKN